MVQKRTQELYRLSQKNHFICRCGQEGVRKGVMVRTHFEFDPERWAGFGQVEMRVWLPGWKKYVGK